MEKSAMFQMEVVHEKEKAAEAAKNTSDERRLGADFAEQEKFVPASRTTDADKSDDRTSVHRKLAEKLFLMVKNGDADFSAEPWRMPQAMHMEGEALHETAARSAQAVLNEETEIHFVSNAPSYCQTIPALGMKVFYFRAALVDINPQMELDTSQYSQFQWLSKSEIEEISNDYFNDIVAFVE